MSWIKKTGNWMGPYSRKRSRPQYKRIERVYSVSEVAELLSVSRNTVFKWLSLDEPEFAVIPPNGWIRLPSGHIRIKEWVIKKLLEEEK